MKRYPSIFNNALAPVTPGPSSSNTCGPARGAQVCRRLFARKPIKLIIEISTKGNLYHSFRGMNTDLAYITGALDRACTHPRFIYAKKDAAAEGMEVEFIFSDSMPGTPTHIAFLTFVDESGEQMRFRTNSLGGGSFAVDEIDGCPVLIEGDQEEALFFTDLLSQEEMNRLDSLAQTFPGFNSAVWSNGADFRIFNIKTDAPLTESLAQLILSTPGVRFMRQVRPVLEVVSSASRQPPFETTTEMLAYAKKTGLSLWQLALSYEASLSGRSEEQVLALAKERWQIILSSIEGGFQPGNDMNGIVPTRAPDVKAAFASNPHIPMGAIDIGAPVALAIMEYSNCAGIVTCIPTGGSSGVVPGAILGASSALGKSEEEMVRALLVAGLMGVFMERTKYLGAMGCQMEIGCAAGMAAAALVSLMEGSAAQACTAAVMAMQNYSGLLCDKLAGVVQVPCFNRNMTAVAISMTVANAAMAGMEALVPLEETVDYMIRVGDVLRSQGINRMGACSTPAGCQAACEQKARFKNL